MYASTQIYIRCESYKNELPATLLIRGEIVMEGGVYSLLNPLVEAGLVNLRCLVEFLGVKRNSQNNTLADRKGRLDDVVIESFKYKDIPLSKVTPNGLCSVLDGHSPLIVNNAICHTLEMADKAIAHVTKVHNVTSTDLTQVAIASKCVETAVMTFLYDAMGLERPNIGVVAIAESAS